MGIKDGRRGLDVNTSSDGVVVGGRKCVREAGGSIRGGVDRERDSPVGRERGDRSGSRGGETGAREKEEGNEEGEDGEEGDYSTGGCRGYAPREAAARKEAGEGR